MMKINILRILMSCVFVLSNTFCSDMFVNPNCINIHNPAISFCINKDTGSFIDSALNWVIFNIPKEYKIRFHEYVTTTDLNSISEDLPVWYSIIGNCRLFFILNKNYCSSLRDISYESLPDKCKKLLNGNVKELRKKCDIKIAQELSLLTAINTSWDNALSAMKEIVGKRALSHNYTLTEALFILHLNPSQSCFNNLIDYFKKSNYEDKNVLFYANCLTGALACILKHRNRIPANFEFEILSTDDAKGYFLWNAKRLMQAYKDNFINKRNNMNRINNNKKEIEINKKKVNNTSQEEEKRKLKQD